MSFGSNSLLSRVGMECQRQLQTTTTIYLQGEKPKGISIWNLINFLILDRFQVLIDVNQNHFKHCKHSDHEDQSNTPVGLLSYSHTLYIRMFQIRPQRNDKWQTHVLHYYLGQGPLFRAKNMIHFYSLSSVGVLSLWLCCAVCRILNSKGKPPYSELGLTDDRWNCRVPGFKRSLDSMNF